MSQKTTINIIFISQTILLQFLPFFVSLPAPIISININCFHRSYMYSIKLITHSYWQKSWTHCTALLLKPMPSKESITSVFSCLWQSYSWSRDSRSYEVADPLLPSEMKWWRNNVPASKRFLGQDCRGGGSC
jgi:hypothetical protein